MCLYIIKADFDKKMLYRCLINAVNSNRIISECFIFYDAINADENEKKLSQGIC